MAQTKAKSTKPSLKETIQGLSYGEREEKRKEYKKWLETAETIELEVAKSKLTTAIKSLLTVAETMKGQASLKQQADIEQALAILSGKTVVNGSVFTADTVQALLESTHCTSIDKTKSWSDICKALGANPRSDNAKTLKQNIDSGRKNDKYPGIHHNGQKKRASGYYYHTPESAK